MALVLPFGGGPPEPGVCGIPLGAPLPPLCPRACAPWYWQYLLGGMAFSPHRLPVVLLVPWHLFSSGTGISPSLRRKFGYSWPGARWRDRCSAPRITPLQRCEIIAVACEPPPQEEGLTGWTLARLRDEILREGIVKELSVSHLGSLLSRLDIKPHKMEMWLHSRDPLFREKVAEIVALYLNPPRDAVVVCIDEKTGMQAVERKYKDEPSRVHVKAPLFFGKQPKPLVHECSGSELAEKTRLFYHL